MHDLHIVLLSMGVGDRQYYSKNENKDPQKLFFKIAF